MKKNKEKVLDAVLEGVVELVLTVVFFAVGFLICLGISSVFSINTENLDFDSLVLIGIISLVVIVVIFSLVKRFFKRLKNKQK